MLSISISNFHILITWSLQMGFPKVFLQSIRQLFRPSTLCRFPLTMLSLPLTVLKFPKTTLLTSDRQWFSMTRRQEKKFLPAWQSCFRVTECSRKYRWRNQRKVSSYIFIVLASLSDKFKAWQRVVVLVVQCVTCPSKNTARTAINKTFPNLFMTLLNVQKNRSKRKKFSFQANFHCYCIISIQNIQNTPLLEISKQKINKNMYLCTQSVQGRVFEEGKSILYIIL